MLGQAAAKYQGLRPLRPVITYQGNNRALAHIVSGMAARLRDAAAKEEPPVPIKQERVSGCFSAKSAGFAPAHVRRDSYSGNRRRASPKAGVVPSGAHGFGFNKENVSAHPALDLGHDLGQFADARSCAWAARVREHHQGRLVIGAFNSRVCSPGLRNHPDAAGCGFIV